jgi:Ca-activated chloride channel family protein
MSFSNPQWLNALFLVPALALLFLYGAKRRRRALVDFAGPKYEEALAPGRSWRKGGLKAILRILGFSLLVLALSGPQIGSQLVKVEREGIDLVIALDVSLSMLAEDMKPNRLERAKQEIIDLIQGLRGDRVGIVVFAGDAFVLCPLTVDYDAALMFANTADVDVVSKPGSAIHEALKQSVALFPTTQEADRVIILVTDGETHDGDPAAEAESAAEQGIRVYTIGIGNPSGELIPLRGTDGSIDGYKKDDSGQTVLTRLDESTLRDVAKITGGKYLPATREGLELKVLYREISGMEKKAVKGEFMERKKDRFVWFLAAAFLLLALDLLLSAGGSRRTPRRTRMLHTGAAGVFALVLAAVVSGFASPVRAAKTVDGGRVKSGNKYYKASEYQKALVLYKEAMGDTLAIPEHGEGVLYNEANTLHMMGRYQEALQKYHESFSDDTLQAGRVLYNRGNTLVKMGKLPEAVESYLQSLRYMPDDLDARHNLELALKMIEQQEQQQKQQQQDQDEKGEQDPSGDGERPQNDEQQRQNEDENEGDQQQQPQPPDSTQSNPPSEQDSSSAQPQRPDSTQVMELSREDALQLLKLLEEQEKELQKKKKKAAFRRAAGSGKDW